MLASNRVRQLLYTPQNTLLRYRWPARRCTGSPLFWMAWA